MLYVVAGFLVGLGIAVFYLVVWWGELMGGCL
jgi:hypothetical protein